MATELHATKINNYLILFNAKLASSYIGGVSGNALTTISYDTLSERRAKFFVKQAHQAKRIVIITKEPYRKLISGLVTIFVSGFNNFPRMVQRFEKDNGYNIGHSQKLIDKIKADPNQRVMDEGFIFHRDFTDGEREYFVNLFSYLMKRSFKDSNILSDAHIRPHHFTAVLIMTELILKHNVPKEKFVYLDITEQNQLLIDIVESSISVKKKKEIKEQSLESVQNASSDSWKNVLAQAYYTMEAGDNVAIQDRISHEDECYKLLKNILSELTVQLNE
jgi:hypothetical protein